MLLPIFSASLFAEKSGEIRKIEIDFAPGFRDNKVTVSIYETNAFRISVEKGWL